MPSIRALLFAVSITFAGLVTAVSPARASGTVFDGCGGAGCKTYAESCQEYFNNWTGVTKITKNHNSDGSLNNVACWIDPDGFLLPGTLVRFHYCKATNDIIHSKTDIENCPPVPWWEKILGYVCEGVGNPIHPLTGNKYEVVTDFTTAGPDILEFKRTYNSLDTNPFGIMNLFWRTTYDRSIFFASNGINAFLRRDDGKVFDFVKTGGTWGPAANNNDVEYTLVANGSDWDVTTPDGHVETYDSNGRLTSIEARNGYTQTLTYDGNGLLTTVSDSHNRQLTFAYNSMDRLIKLTTPDNQEYHYSYTSSLALLKDVTYPDNGTVTYHYENTTFLTHLTGITDANGVRFATFEYDAEGRAITSKHAGDADKVTLVYDTVNNKTTVTNALGKDTVYHYTVVQGVPKVTQVEGVASANCLADDSLYAYDSNGYRNSWTDREGNVTTYVNNARGLPTSSTEASGTALARTITTSWHASYPLPTQIVRPGLTVDFTYDADGNLLTRTETDTTSHSVPYSTNGQTRVWTYTYSTAGQLKTVDGPLTGAGDTTTYDYDTSGYLTKVTDPLGHITDVVSVNGRGLPTSIEDPNGITSDLTYDARGRLLTRTVNPGAGEAVTTFAYDAVGQITKITLPDGSELNYAYDDAQRLTKVSNLDGEEIVYTLDLMGNITKEEIKDTGGTLKKTQTRTFDELGRMLKSIGAGTQETAFSYNKNDDLKTVTDPKSNVTTNAYDALNRLITVTDALTNDADTAYDAADNLTGVTDQRSLTTSYVHNGFGDVIRRTSPDTGITDYEYDKAANVTKKTDARSVVVTYAYDDASRITTKTFPASTGENVTYTYDDVTGGNYGKGRLTKIEDASGSTSFVYDARGNVITETRVIGAQSYVTSYVYDSADNLTQMTYPSGRIVTYLRDRLGRVAYVTTKKTGSDPEQFLASNIQYLPFGPISSITYGNGQRATLSYDQDYRITGIDTTDGTTTVQDLSYTYDLASNISGITDTLDIARNQTLDYDVLHRLTDADGVYGDIDYVYDAVGNRTSRVVTDGGVTTDTLTYAGTSNRLLTVATGGATRTVTYTANGNITTDSRGSGFDYLYNHANRMHEVKENAATVATYTYNDMGQRVIKDLAGGAKTHFHFDLNGILIGESTDLGVSQREYITLAGLPIAVIDAGTTPTAPTETTQDNGDAGTSSTGTWNTDTAGTGYEGTNYVARSGGTGTNAYTWAPTIPADGQYRIYAKWPSDPDLGSTAKYTVHHDQGSDTVTVDQRKDGGQWNPIGVHTLKAGQNHRIELSDEADSDHTGEIVIIDNLDPRITTTGTWGHGGTWTGGGRYWDSTYSSTAGGGTGDAIFTWPADVPKKGHYRVHVRWVGGGRPHDAKYTVHHGGGSTLVQVDQRRSGGKWVFLGHFDLDPLENHRVELSNDAAGGTYVVADAVRYELVPESYADEVTIDNTDPITSSVGPWSTSTYTGAGIYWGPNYGQTAANGAGNDIFTWPAAVNKGRYRVYAHWIGAGNQPTNAKYTVHHAGGSTQVVVNQRINSTNWRLLGDFDFEPGQNHRVDLSDDANGNWVIADAIRFVRVAPTSTEEIVIDNMDPRTTTTGTWSTSTWTGGGPYWDTNYSYTAANGTGADIFTWPADVAQGRYDVAVRWVGSNNQPTNAKYTVHHADGSTQIEVNQKLNSTNWIPLGNFLFVPGQSHRVELSDDANGTWVIADAVRFRRNDLGSVVVADAIKIVPNTAEDALYVHADHLGTPQKMTDDAAAVVWDATYRPFGTEDAITGTATNEQRFPGQFRDAETGLHYNYFRDYDPAIGRYIQSDRIGLGGGLNTYAYVLGNPISYTDPTGEVIPLALRFLWLAGNSYLTASGIVECLCGTGMSSVVECALLAATAGKGKWLKGFGIAGRLGNRARGGANHARRGDGPSGGGTGRGSRGGDRDGDGPAARGSGRSSGASGKEDTGPRNGGIPDDAIVCRGGSCTAGSFSGGSGVRTSSDGNLSGVSVSSAPGKSVRELTRTIPHNQVGVSTVGAVRRAGGDVIPRPTRNNPNHCELCGISASQAERLFTPTIRNPNRPAR